MTKPHILQIVPYPACDDQPLNLAYNVNRLYEASNSDASLTTVGPKDRGIATRAAPGANMALLATQEQGRLGSAALDLFEGEPTLDPRFLSLPNVQLQPHHSSATFETRKAMGQLMRDNLAAHFAGQPLPTAVL